MKIRFQYFFLPFLICLSAKAQDISLLEQFNGRYDFTLIGNTLNTAENTFGACEILTSSSANLQLNPEDQIEKAYLYWAGSGTGDLEVQLNGNTVTAERTFATLMEEYDFWQNRFYQLPFFSAFADVTNLVKSSGNTTYTLSDLDLRNVITNYCFNSTNFGGWAIVVVYKNENFPLYQLNVYDGLQMVPEVVTINLDNLNVIDNQNARIGFIAWEGDQGIAVNETLRINGNILSNPPLNPTTNAFNGTNSITGSAALYNMDLDIYPIENNISIGDTQARIQLTSDQDVIMINTVVTRLNSQLPDATVSAVNQLLECGSRTVVIDVTTSNLNSTAVLPQNTPVLIRLNEEDIHTFTTSEDIAIGASLTQQIELTIEERFGTSLNFQFVVDPANIVPEINDTNNDNTLSFDLVENKLTFTLYDDYTCNRGGFNGIYELDKQTQVNQIEAGQTISYHESEEEAANGTNDLDSSIPFSFSEKNKVIYGRIEQNDCFNTSSFLLSVINCPPVIRNFISPNNDGANDIIDFNEIKNVFPNMEIEIYSRWGQLVWKGNHDFSVWNGIANQGAIETGNGDLPGGTYFYVVNLNDENHPEAMKGYLYLSKD